MDQSWVSLQQANAKNAQPATIAHRMVWQRQTDSATLDFTAKEELSSRTLKTESAAMSARWEVSVTTAQRKSLTAHQAPITPTAREKLKLTAWRVSQGSIALGLSCLSQRLIVLLDTTAPQDQLLKLKKRLPQAPTPFQELQLTQSVP